MNEVEVIPKMLLTRNEDAYSIITNIPDAFLYENLKNTKQFRGVKISSDLLLGAIYEYQKIRKSDENAIFPVYIDSQARLRVANHMMVPDGETYIIPIWVNVYMVDRAYGGPEEGGWWYNAFEPVASYRIHCKPDENIFEKAWRTRHHIIADPRYSNEGRRPISTVLSNGEYNIVIEFHEAEASPRCKPYYE